MRENSRVADYTSIPVALLLALCLAGGRSEGGIEPPPAPVDVRTFTGTVDLELGEIDGDDPHYLFAMIGSIVEDSRGRMIVADLQAHEVRVFDSDGAFLFLFGGQGEGPGDLTQPCCLGFGPDSMLWVRESTRYSAFRLDHSSAEYDRGVRIALGAGGLVRALGRLVAPVTFDAGGRLVDIGVLMTEDGSVLARLHHGPDGAVQTVIMVDPERRATGSTMRERKFGEMEVTFIVRQPFGPRWIHAHGPGGGWAEAVTSEYSVMLHHPDGTVSRIEGPQLPDLPLSPSERERAQAAIDRDLQRIDRRNHPFGIPKRKQPLDNIFFDRSGRLWVEKTGTDGDEMREAGVYAGSELVARYRWPRRVQVGPVPWASESKLYGTISDTLGVQIVARVRFEPDS